MSDELDIRHVSENRVLMDDCAVVDYYLGPPDRGVSTVAHELHISKARVSAILHCAGVMRPAGVGGKTKPAGVYAINGGQALRAARRAVPLSQDELASRVGTVQATVSGLETRFGYAVSEEQAYRFAAALDRPFGELFTRDRPAARLLDTESSSQVPRTKRAEVRAAEEHAEAHGWWTTKQAADYVKVTERTLHAYQERGYVAAVDERQFGTLPFKFWDPEVIRRLARDRLTSDDSRTAAFRDPVAVYRRTFGRLGSEDAAKAAAGRARARAKRRTQVVEGRKHGQQGGPAGIHAGREGGRPVFATREQAAAVWRLRDEAQTYRSIAEAVFGDARYKDRVARILRGNERPAVPPSAVA